MIIEKYYLSNDVRISKIDEEIYLLLNIMNYKHVVDIDLERFLVAKVI